jgi:hypothetical protein
MAGHTHVDESTEAPESLRYPAEAGMRPGAAGAVHEETPLGRRTTSGIDARPDAISPERARLELRSSEGVDASEEGGAALSALRELGERRERFDGPLVLFNTGSALKYGPRRSAAGVIGRAAAAT